jgi:DNA-binding transcriptional LysR family regulator
MDIDEARTFLAICAHGSFLAAADALHLTQSTVSARVQRLEDSLGTTLFLRNRRGASLTLAGQRFYEHAKRLVRVAEQARQEVGLPSRYTSTLRVGARIALWENLLPAWVGWLRSNAPDVALRAEIGFEEDLMQELVSGSMDLALMYTPAHQPGLVVEHLFDETLILVSSRPEETGLPDDYIYVEWGPAFHMQHTQSYPAAEPPPQVVNIGWLALQLILENGGACYLPERMARPYLDSGRLFAADAAQRFPLAAYVVYPRGADQPVLNTALSGLRQLADALKPQGAQRQTRVK